MDDDDEFFDTSSLTSSYLNTIKRKSNNKDYISLSRNTIYHSAVDLDMELDTLDARRSPINKTWRSFSIDDLSVDFVLAYEETNESDKEKREIFEANLKQCGLVLEKEENQKIRFVKIHAPREVLCQYAEILKMRLPMKKDPEDNRRDNFITSFVLKILDLFNITLSKSKFPEHKYKLTAEFSRERSYLFNTEDENFFDTSVKISVVSYILQREMYGPEKEDKGIKNLLSTGVYKAAYPLHDGDLSTDGSKRKLLLDEWASVRKWIKFQPIDDIKDYFGIKFALYFTWLGFYTHMLIPASLVGILCIIYGLFSLKDDLLSDDICETNITMCPLCDKYCNYWKLSDSCTYSKIAHVIDNPATIFFAVFMSFWATLYLETWKRYSAEIAHRWGLTGLDLQAEPPRPEYLTRLANAKKLKINLVTHLKEPTVPFWRVKLPSIILSFTIATFWALIALAVVFGIVLYRMSLITSDALYEDRTSYRIYVLPITAAIINLICILALNYVYERLAVWLTEMELPRTQTEFDDSLTVKIYMFQFVNYYSSIFYIAFIKGKFVGYPAKYNKIFGLRQEECNPGGCLMELTIQLAIIMVGNQTLNSIMEMVQPFLIKLYNTYYLKKSSSEEDVIACNQWTEDYKLSDSEPRGLCTEYLEMVLQYGFVTIFVTAFPLAPLFALINNVLEMRLDAKKMIKFFRRPVPQRVKDIGVWLPIMNFIGRISVVSNAFIIAFSSHFVPKLVYVMKYSKRGTQEGFLEYSLAYFNTSDFMPETAPEGSNFNISICRYPEFRNPPEHEHKYKRPLDYWHILAARLAFIVVYQNLVSFIINVIQWSIPDIPRKLMDQIKREAYITNETIIKHEAGLAHKKQERFAKSKNRESVMSGDTVYMDVNGEPSFPLMPTAAGSAGNGLHNRYANQNHIVDSSNL